MGALVGLVAIAVFVGVMWLVVAFVQQVEEANRRAWEAYASSRGFAFRGPAGSWYNRGSMLVTGTVEQVGFELDTYVVSTGKSSVSYTRLRARALVPIASDIRVSTAHIFSGLGRMLGLQDVPTGDAAFDEKYVVKADRDDDARALLDAPTRKGLFEFPKSVRFEYRHGEVELHWLGVERDAAVLDAATRIVAAACRWRREPEVYR